MDSGERLEPQILEAAKLARQRGDVNVALSMVASVLQRSPRNIDAWLLLANLVDDPVKQAECYRRVLGIEPTHSEARRSLQDLMPSNQQLETGGAAIHGQGAPDPSSTSTLGEDTEPVLRELEKSRQELLDLNLNNKLLNHKQLKTKGLEIVDEVPAEVYRILVEEGRTMSFLPSEDEAESDESGTANQAELGLEDEVAESDDSAAGEEAPHKGQPVENNGGVASRQIDNKLQTPYSSEDLQRRLLNTYYTSRTYVEEQGVNTLFLALGMLEWYESDASDIARRAPLVLIPVEVSRTEVTARFRLSFTGEEIGENLSLRAKLLSDFRLTLPDFPEMDDLNVSDYFEAVRQRVQEQSRWQVRNDEMALAFFSYAKFLMFKDLESEAWPEGLKPNENRLLRGLLSDGFDLEIEPIEEADLIDELLPPESVNHVLDSDSSQALAILEVSKGRDLVIHGPPGTGKSQTIANLIAEAISEGKTVLFVSEKMAALEVVKRRLDQNGLGAACLELHSRKTNKKAVLAELESSMRLGAPNRGGAADVEGLARTQIELNAYARAVNTEIGTSGVTPFEAYGLMIRARTEVEEAEPPRLEIEGADGWSRQEYLAGREAVRELQTHVARMGVPEEHPFSESRMEELLPGSMEELRSVVDGARQSALELIASSSSLAETLGMPEPHSPSDTDLHADISRLVLDAPSLEGLDIGSPRWQSDRDLIDRALTACSQLRALRLEYGPIVMEDKWGAEVSELVDTIARYRPRFWRILSGTYRSARAEACKLAMVEINRRPGELLKLLRIIEEEKRLALELEAFEPTGKELFRDRWQGGGSDTAALKAAGDYLAMVHARIEEGSLPTDVLRVLERTIDPVRLESVRSAAIQLMEEYKRRLIEAISTLGLDHVYGLDSSAPLDDMTYEQQVNLLETWRDGLPRLQEVITLRHLSEVAKEHGLGNVIEIANTWRGAGKHLVALFDYASFLQLVNRAFRERSVIKNFNGPLHKAKIERFCDLDRNLLRQNQVKLAIQHYRMVPRHDAPGQLAILRHEFQKKRRHMPIRKLMAKAGNVIQRVKPVFMMSPLSIATYLPPGTIQFDRVIFDEASQVKPVDAFGAMLRGSQIIVAGDNHQLPPTSFFETVVDVDEDYSESVTIDLESVLRLSLAKGIPSRMLNWHYRSEHESLIAVSNHEFYDDRLVIFPSPDRDKESLGLAYHYLPNTIYGRGGSRKNIGEAKIVAQAVMDHAKRAPQLTLGVAAFSVSQADAVREQLEILRRQDPSLEDFFHDHPHEPFFVKNLENVQGDERDVIYISVGYGRDENGLVSMNFGPLNGEGGERRLNVLITRARKRCEVFTNLEPEDIDLSRSRARGVEVLKRFLGYATTGRLDIAGPTGRDPDSPFEVEVAREIRGLGYRVEYQVGQSGFFIDLGIVDPDKPGRYLLGIECDGATYHSARSARERDRLREEVLRRLGWEIHRIWSTDWVRDPKRELLKVKNAIEEAREKSHEKSAGVASGDSPPGGPAFDRTATSEPGTETPRVPNYVIASVDSAGYKDQLHEVSSKKMATWIKRVVEIEGPVHTEEVARRILDSAGVKRFGRRIRANYSRGVNAAIRDRMVEKRGEFLWIPGSTSILVRSRSNAPASTRNLEKVSPEEIAAAVREFARRSFGIPRADIPREVCTLLGFARTSQEMADRVDAITGQMLDDGELTEQAGFMTLP